MRCNFLLLVLLLAIPVISKSQYLNKLYDHDTTADWGYHVFVQPDNNYFIIGAGIRGTWRILAKTVDPNGTELAKKEVLKGPGTFSWYDGEPGGAKRLSNGDYIVPVTVIRSHFGFNIKLAGLTRLAPNGDTLWLKWHSDTMFSGNMEFANMVNLMPDKGYITANIKRGGVNSDAVLRRTDSNGNVLWTAMHDANGFYSCEYIGDGKILVGANKTRVKQIPGDSYQTSQPWFLVYDTLGNLLKDTLYSTHYGGGGKIYKDKNGGFFHWGNVDSLLVSSPSSIVNFPEYIAHLDDSFKVTWIKNYASPTSKVFIWNVKQLKDDGYLLIGQKWDTFPNPRGWAAKLNKWGFTEWDNSFYVDSIGTVHYLVDAAERSDGSIVLTGSVSGHPNFNHGQDVWVVVVDSIGCIIPNCAPTSVASVQKETEISVYPNPTSGSFKATVPAKGSLSVYSMVGKKVTVFSVKESVNEVRLPTELASGIYMLRFVPDGGGKASNFRLVYQP
ncbi:MAG TPA: T9SS type A sorting domain-containing protein [Flavipsychrobacter sp.]|nr:T9SS type A sorting domain-containing protein [Flavipsychrobacter sp.]